MNLRLRMLEKCNSVFAEEIESLNREDTNDNYEDDKMLYQRIFLKEK